MCNSRIVNAANNLARLQVRKCYNPSHCKFSLVQEVDHISLREVLRHFDIAADEMINRILLRLDIGRSDHPCPLRGLIGNVFTELGRSHWHRIAAKVGEALDHLRIGEAPHSPPC